MQTSLGRRHANMPVRLRRRLSRRRQRQLYGARARPDLVRSLLLRRELLLALPAGSHDGTGAMSSTTTRRVPGSIW